MKLMMSRKTAQKALSAPGKVDTFNLLKKRLYGAVKASQGDVQYKEVPTSQPMGYAIAVDKAGMTFSQGSGLIELRVTLPMPESVAKSIFEEIQKAPAAVVPMLCHTYITGVQQSIRKVAA